MSAVESAQLVLRWALNPLGSPPQGDLMDADALADPPENVRDLMRQLWSDTASRLRIDATKPSSPIGTSGIILSAAIAVASIPEIAAALLKVVSATGSVEDWLARHAVLAPALSHLHDEIKEEFLERSLMTGLLDAPGPRAATRARGLLQILLKQSDYRMVVIRHWLSGGRTIAQLRWQRTVLEAFRFGDELEREFVVDVYESAFLLNHDATLHRIDGARRALRNAVATNNGELLLESLAVAEWWAPLWHLARTDLDRLRDRPLLDYRYHDGLGLYSLAQRLTRGSTL